MDKEAAIRVSGESTETKSVVELVIDTFFLYLSTLILAAITLFIFLYFTLASSTNPGAGLLVIPFIIFFVPGLLILSVIYFIILRILFHKILLSRSWKYILYPLIAIVSIVAFYFIHSLWPH